ncbi:TPA: DUF1642 domain-containing protein, partial [Streptococcus equi subsp. zooepidemicus]|nr:DUF1642 domain-containing protein [Streptococcus equi subsp. zooepidemicus]
KDLNTKPDKLRLQDVYEIIDKLDQSLKPEVPQFVADWIEEHKQMYGKWDEEAKSDFVFRAIYDLFRFGEGLSAYDFDISDELSKWTTKNAYKFITAILFGYTVEKEKLYTVEIPNPKNGIAHRHIMLVKTTDGRVVLSEVVDSHIHLRDDLRLTESEIRKDFDWAWREEFPKEVAE